MDSALKRNGLRAMVAWRIYQGSSLKSTSPTGMEMGEAPTTWTEDEGRFIQPRDDTLSPFQSTKSCQRTGEVDGCWEFRLEPNSPWVFRPSRGTESKSSSLVSVNDQSPFVICPTSRTRYLTDGKVLTSDPTHTQHT